MVLLAGIAGPAAAQQPTPAAPPSPEARVAALKTSLQTGLAGQRNYEWIETTAVSMKGEEKKRTQNRCYYGADGKLEKVPIEGESESGGKRGLRGKAVENKKEDIGETMKQAVALVKGYVPPDPARIQAAKEAGKLAVMSPDPSGQVQVKISDYLKPGDSMTMSLDAAKNSLLGIAVNSYMKDADDVVTMKATLGALGDGTIYPATITLDIKSENLTVAIENSGYKKTTAP
jgi:hypothetical protein